MKQIALLNHSQGTPYLRDVINKWIVEADIKGWEILDIFIPSGGMIAIIYEVSNKEEIAEIIEKYGITKS